MKNNSYWEKRLANNLWNTYNNSSKYQKELIEIYKKATDEILEELYRIASKYEEAKYILDKISWQGNLIAVKREDLGLPAERPKFSKLSCKKIKEKLGITIPDWKDAIDRYFKDNNK